MMRILLTFALIFSAWGIFAQPPGGYGQKEPSITGKISGTIIDTITQQPVEFATVVLINEKTQKQLDGTITDEDGSFKLTDVKTGTYTLNISFLGYESKELRQIELTLEKPDADAGNIFLLSEGINLDEIEVTAEASLIENRIDKVVYNAEKDATNAGGDASDVLRKVPLLNVDIDGNVSLRGSNNVQILVNGRPSGIFANSVADALKSIPSDQIKSVEVITTPTAKYDGEGSAGIINIITKKKSVEGFSGSANSSIGTRQNNAGVNINVAKGRFGFNASGNTYFSWPRNGFQDFTREEFTQVAGQQVTTSMLEQDGVTKTFWLGFNGSAGAFYDINAYNSLSSSVRINGFNNTRDGNIEALFTEYTIDDPILTQYDRSSFSGRLSSGFDWTTDYRKTFKTPEQELVFAFQLSGNINDRTTEIDQQDVLGNNPDFALLENNTNDGRNNEYTFQVDYTHPFSESIKMETGAKSVLRRLNSDYQYDVFDFDSGQYATDVNRTDIFAYNQDVWAGYLSFNLKFGEKWGLVAGARYEHTSISGEYQSERQPFSNEYDNLLPSVILSRSLTNFQTIKASYTRRIQRPSLFFINPFVDLSDPFNVSFGNPELDPEITDQYELSYNTFIKGLVLNVSTFYRRTFDQIESFVQIQEGARSETKYLNIGINNSFGANIFTSITLFKKWTIRGGINAFTYDTRSTVDTIALENQAILLSGNLSSSLKLEGGWQIEAFGFYRAPRQTLQGRNPTFSLFSMGVQKEIWDKRGSIGIRVVEPFSVRKDFPSEIEGQNFRQTSNFSVPFQSFGISFRYRFGKLDFKEKRRRGSIRNDDLKEGGGNNF